MFFGRVSEDFLMLPEETAGFFFQRKQPGLKLRGDFLAKKIRGKKSRKKNLKKMSSKLGGGFVRTCDFVGLQGLDLFCVGDFLRSVPW